MEFFLDNRPFVNLEKENEESVAPSDGLGNRNGALATAGKAGNKPL